MPRVRREAEGTGQTEIAIAKGARAQKHRDHGFASCGKPNAA
jgi:hypothetical protein